MSSLLLIQCHLERKKKQHCLMMISLRLRCKMGHRSADLASTSKLTFVLGNNKFEQNSQNTCVFQIQHPPLYTPQINNYNLYIPILNSSSASTIKTSCHIWNKSAFLQLIKHKCLFLMSKSFKQFVTVHRISYANAF